MKSVRMVLGKLRAFARRARRDEALTEEITCHLELLADEFKARGLSEHEARARARREFGSVDRVRESARDAQGFPRLESLWSDAAFALRQLRRSPSFTIAAVLTLAVGIGGTTGIFSVLDVVAIRDLPYPQPDRLVVIHEGLPRFDRFPASAADATFWETHLTSIERLALVDPRLMNLTGAGEPERLQVGNVSPRLLPMLGARAQLGRLLVDEDARPGDDAVVVLSDGLWRRRFGADPTIIGRSIILDGSPHDVIGVLDAGFRPPNIKHLFAIPVPDMLLAAWKPLVLTPAERPVIGGYSYPVLARLKPTMTVDQAQQELSLVQAELRRAVPGKGELSATMVPLQAQMASRSRSALLLLLAATVVVLLIGCVNTANLLSARMLSRQRELAVRAAIGAGRMRLVRQILVEHSVLGLLGGAVGLAVAVATMRTIVWLAPVDIPRLDEVSLDARVVLFAAAVSLAAGILIGLPSVFRLSAGDLRPWLSPRSDGGIGARRGSYSLLVVGEVGACAACLGVALLLSASLRELNGVDKGFDAGHLLTAGLNLPANRYASPEQQAALIDAVSDDIRQAPGVAAVAASTQVPLTGTGSLSALSAVGVTVPPMERPVADVRSVTPDYFQAVDLAVRQGRLIEARDRDRQVAVLSETLAAQAWPGENPIGRQFRLGVNPASTVYEVIGVVGDIRGTALDQPLTPTAYLPFPQRARGIVSLMVKTEGNPSQLAGAVRDAVRTRDPELPAASFKTMEEVIAGSLDARRFQLNIVGVFAILAVLLAGIGVYGVMAYSVDQRRGEFGVRLALGARPRTLVLQVIGRGVRLALAGLLVAIPIGWMAGSAVRSFLYGVSPFDPEAIGLTAIATFALAVAATAVPAIRASRLHPVAVLRHE